MENKINKEVIENETSEESKEIKNIINNSSDKLIQNLSNIFAATKFNSNDKRLGNIDINENMDSIANEINTLLNIVNKLKIKEIKNYPQKNTDDSIKINDEIPNNDIEGCFQKKREHYKKNQKKLKNDLKFLEELNQNINNTIFEMKKSEFYLLSKKICGV